ncbi:MAG TPA: peptidoglycan DD-metalloendopeptidase family protein [Euzebya sp.]|nr:peptidoglycan DD-metalloendopeptidase family protein [Euzebya sp.]
MRTAVVVTAAPVLLVLALPLLFGVAARPGPSVAMHADIPPVAMAAYLTAADLLAQDPDATGPGQGCRPSWALLAAIGKIETDHARFGGAVLDAGGTAVPPILGVVLDGRLPGTRAIPDTDEGRLDGNGAWDRAVGPMQFIPQTWLAHQRDGNGDGHHDPQNLFDAATTAAVYLCSHVIGDIATREGITTAVFAYNRSAAYVEAALAWMDTYLAQVSYPSGDQGVGPIACPVAGSVQFIDSWHFPRSGQRVHKGQDLFAVEGTPLVALDDATVTDVGHHRGLGGNVVWLVTDAGHAWYYAHLQRFAPGLSVGQQLRRGEAVGTVGRTGNARSTPAHLHIQWRPTGRGGADVNPYDLLSTACPGHRDPR